MRKSEQSTGFRLLKAGVAVAATAAAVVAGAATPAFAASVPMTLSATTGPAQGGNTLIGKTATAVFTATAPPAVEFTVGTSCPATYSNVVTVTATAGVVKAVTVKKLSSTQISILVPAGVDLPANTSTLKYNVCAYSGTSVASAAGVTPVVVGSPLIANATYTIATKPILANSPISPATGPALGGTPVTITGNGTYKFPTTGVTATLGGEPLTGISVASDQLSFTGITPAHAAATGQTLSVTTSGGTVTKASAFAFTNGINVTPNTSAGGGNVDILVEGAGIGDAFTAYSAGLSTTDTAHIYLVQGSYDPEDDGNGDKTVAPIADASAITYIGPNQVLATFNLANSLDGSGVANNPVDPVEDGAYTVTWVSNGDVDVQSGGTNEDPDKPYVKSIVTSGSTFTVADY
ncbi:IPT/TIG domain-containing protein [Actinoplanes sp. NPDC051633]|uniref:IPT/TIG domain-containing protein n=1 Tax=Actinoplanes sp. NPDC051633 TaxID=3155670 RepID=UPI00343B57A2